MKIRDVVYKKDKKNNEVKKFIVYRTTQDIDEGFTYNAAFDLSNRMWTGIEFSKEDIGVSVFMSQEEAINR